MPDKSPRIPSIFRDGAHVSPAARGSGEGNRLVTRVGHPASDRAKLSSSRRRLRAITSNSFPRSRPPRSPYRSSYLVAHPTLVRPSLHSLVRNPIFLPSSPRHTQPRSSVYSRARVLSVSHVASAKQIDPSSPSSHARDFWTVHDTAQHAKAR